VPRFRRFLLIAAVIAGLAVLFQIIRANGLWPTREEIELQVKTLGIWGPLALFALRGVSIVLPALPSTVFSLVAGAVLGFRTGFITIVVADLIFCQAAFLLARNYGRDPVRKLVGNRAMGIIEGFNRNQLEGNPFLLSGLLMTGLFDFVCYAVGLGGTRWRAFILPLLFSVILSDAPTVALGAGIFSDNNSKLLIGAAVFGVFGLAVIAGWVKKRTRKQAGSDT